MFLVGSEDMNTRVHAVENLWNFGTYSVSGHVDAVVNAFFEINSLNVSFKLHDWFNQMSITQLSMFTNANYNLFFSLFKPFYSFNISRVYSFKLLV